MIRVYYLPIQLTDNTEAVAGTDIIHDALLETTPDPDIRKLLMDTSAHEHTALLALALRVRDPTPEEIQTFNALPSPIPPTQDEIRAKEILATSPDAITMPQIWELLRIYGRRLGYPS